ncbi:peptidase U32 [Candidatus Magnetominusculus xianensis]|uniref:Peptidase U32 n=2 Tax=Candidatus Magnetominusculus xianensis TaxID=1748249 RepID=A0ABR5SBP6_9BACT|nr:peptidase U32 [Candidatus Magnetominusculus xianensis]
MGKLRAALHYGADAVYLGLTGFSLRAKAGNFTLDTLRDAITLVHEANKRAYVTINIFPHNTDIAPIEGHITALNDLHPDAVIVSDIGVFDMIKTFAPEIPIHVSTQANITNYRSARMWERLGAKRLVLSRELTIDEIRRIRDAVSIELECFVHGSICLSYSGRCYLSSFLANRGANKGLCTNSCRWSYQLVEEKRPGESMPVYEDNRGAYILSPRDLCMVEHLDKLAGAGVDSFKIEGRTKGINYVSGVTKIYRDAIDALAAAPLNSAWLKELEMFSNRGFTTGMYFGRHPDSDYSYDETHAPATYAIAGVVKGVTGSTATVLLKGNLAVGDEVAFLSTAAHNGSYIINELRDAEGQISGIAHNEDIVFMEVPEGVKKNDIIRRRV